MIHQIDIWFIREYYDCSSSLTAEESWVIDIQYRETCKLDLKLDDFNCFVSNFTTGVIAYNQYNLFSWSLLTFVLHISVTLYAL
jgi:hypothetical protein